MGSRKAHAGVVSLSRSIELVKLSAAAPEDVWAVLIDVPSAASTLSGVDAVRVLTAGEYAAGYRWRETRTMLSKTVTEEMMVAVSEPPGRTVVEAGRDSVRYYSEFNLVPDESGGTILRMTFTGELVDPTWIQRAGWRLFGAWGLRMSARVMQQDLADIAAAAEASRSGQN